MTLSTASQAMLTENSRLIAGGVVSSNRRTDPVLAFACAQGAHLWDIEGKRYIDYHAAFAPHILGHNHPQVNDAVRLAMQRGESLIGSGPASWEQAVATRVKACVPWIERMQVTNTGSEATAHAIRLARAHTGRDHLILTLGGYNGWHNDVARQVSPALAAIGPRRSPGEYPFLPSSAGIPESVRALVHVVNFNDLEAVEAMLTRYPVACLLTEPALQNVGVIPPAPGYLAGLRALCSRAGTVLAFDEVKTGFRAALGGYASICGVVPDLAVYGKAIANGYPFGIVAGRSEILDRFADADGSRRVLIAGTYNAHPFTAAAACATMDVLRADDAAAYRRLETLGARMQHTLDGMLRERGIPGRVSRIGSAFCLYFMDSIPRDWHDFAEHHDHALDARYRRALIERGVYHFPVAAKQGSISLAHSDLDLDQTFEITKEALLSL
jgi:glutamate-1-semialdehyde 2,1-aminomutase